MAQFNKDYDRLHREELKTALSASWEVKECAVCGHPLQFKREGGSTIAVWCPYCYRHDGRPNDVLGQLAALHRVNLSEAVRIAENITGLHYSPDAPFTPTPKGERKAAGQTIRRGGEAPSRGGVRYFYKRDLSTCYTYLEGRGVSRSIQEAHGVTSGVYHYLQRVIIPTGWDRSLDEYGLPRSYVARAIVYPPTDPRLKDMADKGLIGKAENSKGVAEVFAPENLPKAAEQGRPCFVVEGAIDAMSIEAVGGLAVGLGGINQHNALKAALESIPRERRPSLVLCLDDEQDEEKSKFVAAATKTIYEVVSPLVDSVSLGLPLAFHDCNEALVADKDHLRRWVTANERAAKRNI